MLRKRLVAAKWSFALTRSAKIESVSSEPSCSWDLCWSPQARISWPCLGISCIWRTPLTRMSRSLRRLTTQTQMIPSEAMFAVSLLSVRQWWIVMQGWEQSKIEICGKRWRDGCRGGGGECIVEYNQHIFWLTWTSDCT